MGAVVTFNRRSQPRPNRKRMMAAYVKVDECKISPHRGHWLMRRDHGDIEYVCRWCYKLVVHD